MWILNTSVRGSFSVVSELQDTANSTISCNLPNVYIHMQIFGGKIGY